VARLVDTPEAILGQLAAVLLQVALVVAVVADLNQPQAMAALVVLGLAIAEEGVLVEQAAQLELRELRVLHLLLAVAVAAMVQLGMVV
jgi:hypothetical protein